MAAAGQSVTTCLERSALLDLRQALTTEWMLPNGRGGYASGTALGTNTRSTQGLLVAGTDAGPRVLVAKLDEELELSSHDDGERLALSTNEYHDETIHPAGYLYLEEMRVEPGRVTWRWRARGVELEKAVIVEQGCNRTVVRYRLIESRHPLKLRVTPFLTERSPDARTTGSLDWRFPLERRPEGAIVRAWEGATAVGLFSRSGRFIETGLWYWRFLHRADRFEGRDHLEDLYTPGLLAFDLKAGDSVSVVLTAETADLVDPLRVEPTLELAAPAAKPVLRPAPAHATGRNRGKVVSAATAS